MFNVNNKATKTTHFPADLVTFTEEILNGKLHFLCIVREKLYLKTIASQDVTMEVFHNQILQEKLNLVHVKLKCTKTKNIFNSNS